MENSSSSSSSGDPPRSADESRPLDQQRAATPPAPSAQPPTADSGPSETSAPQSAQPGQSHPSPRQAAPATTLWENFMASFRNVIQGNEAPSNQQARQDGTSEAASTSDVNGQQRTAPSQAEAQPGASSSSPNAAAESSTRNRPTSSTQSDANTNGPPRPTVFFRLPFAGPDGNPALLAFHPQPLPPRDGGAPAAQQPTSPAQNASQPSASSTSPGRTDNATNAERSAAGTAGQGPQSHPHPDGHVPIAPLFVPFGASPMPFSFIYDANTQTAWPIAQVTPGSPPGGPSPDAPESQQPRLVAGPPFRIILDIHFNAPPEPERPDPRKAADYVKQLERADAELRARMARLGMGSIGGFGAGDDDQDALLGCGVCLDNYGSEDRPEWIDGPKSQDEAVVAVPCLGHHTLHAGCLRDWLEKLPPSQWTCPFCRANLNSGSSTSAKSIASAQSQSSLRDEVRARERQRGWRCDAPACLPRYPTSSNDGGGHLELPETSDDMTTDLVKLTPCHHEVHLDCLCTSMRVENDLVGTSELDDVGAQPEEDEEERDTVGKWVSCPSCRKECWAQLPLRRRPHRAAANAAPLAESVVEGKVASVTEGAQQDSNAVGTGQESDEEAVVNAMLVPT